MPRPGWIKVVVGLAAAVWTAILVLSGTDVDADWLKPLGGAIGVVTLLLLVYDRWAWRWPGLRRLGGRRVVRGTWKGELRSDWAGDGALARGPIEIYLAVDQTYSEASVTMLTKESKSRTLIATLDNPARSQCTLSGIYLNAPEILRQETSPIHYGGLILEVCGRPVDRLEGSYWTSRGTKGTLLLERRNPAVFESFAQAAAATYKDSSGG